MSGDPKDILGIDLHLGSAVPSPHDARDHLWEEVGFGVAPFNWAAGYDVEAEASAALGSAFTAPTKNQGMSGSCGGQAVSYLGGTFSIFQDKKFDEKSSKYIYAPIAYPGGGTIGRDLCGRVKNNGWCSEDLCVSYENGAPPSEAFMQRVADISSEADNNASHDKAIAYASVNTDIDSVAQAIQANKGIFIGVVGENNGTWLSSHPKPPATNSTNLWGHWLKAGKARINPASGKKEIGVHNSWGPTVGENGWQWLDEDYFNAVLSVATPRPGRAIFEAWTITYNPEGSPDIGFHHQWNYDLNYGAIGDEVKALQDALKIDGEFSTAVPSSGFYGTITIAAVQKFQKKYGIATSGTPWTTGYGRVGPKTREQLNKLFA